jgi:hypothetical protein
VAAVAEIELPNLIPETVLTTMHADSETLASPPALALPWYARGDYSDLLELFCDPENLPATYDAWLERAHEIERQLNDDGFGVAKVRIQPLPFAVRCNAENIPVDQSARLTFVNSAWMEIHAQRYAVVRK